MGDGDIAAEVARDNGNNMPMSWGATGEPKLMGILEETKLYNLFT